MIPASGNLSSVEILDRLVSFDTTSRNSNLAAIEWIRAYLDGLGVPCTVSLDASGEKANLHAVIGPAVPGGIALSGHIDTVPVDGQAWTSDPFVLREEGGKLYGRGTADMKGFVACCLAAVPAFRDAGLLRPAHLFVTFDEEVDCAGARLLCRQLRDSAILPGACIVGEPTGMKPVLGHKGYLVADVSVKGLAGHSSEPGKGVNAIQAAAEAVAWVAAEQRRVAAEGPFSPAFDPPHSTVHVGLMSGGTYLNIIPAHASFRMEWRTVPGEDPEIAFGRFEAHVRALEHDMQAIDPSTGFTITVRTRAPGLALDPDHAVATLVRRLSGSNSDRNVSYGTEAGFFGEIGIPTLICGPGHISEAHKADEWIAKEQLDLCDAFLGRLTVALRHPPGS